MSEAIPYDEVLKYLIFDRDTTFSALKDFVWALGIKPKITSFRSPRQNGTAERMIDTLRRDILDHVIVLSEERLRRLLKEYLCYYHDDLTHLSLNKDSPKGRRPEPRPDLGSEILALPKLGGLHHRRVWEDAA